MATRSGGKKEETLFGLTEKELDPTNPGAMTMGVMRALSLDTIIKDALPGTAVRSILFKAADMWIDPAVELILGAVDKNGDVTTKDQAKAIAHTAVNAAITMSEGSINAWKAFREDAKIRAEINAELAPLHEAGFGSIRASSLQPATANPNKMLEALEQNLQASANANFMKAGADLAIAGGQYYANHLDKTARQEAVAEALKEKYKSEHKNIIDEQLEQKSATFQNDAKKLVTGGRETMTSKIYTGNDTFKTGNESSLKEKFGEDYDRFQKDYGYTRIPNNGVEIYNDKQIHGGIPMPTVALVGAAWAGSKGKEYFEEIRDQKAGKVIAYDLVQCLNEAVQKGDIHKHGEIHLDKFLDEFKGHQFHTIPKNTKKVSVEEFIQEIFHQHIHDQGGEGISGRIEEDFKEVCSKLSDAILGKDTEAMLTGASLHPQALIKLVGEGKLVDHKGLDMNSLDSVMEEIESVRSAMPYEPKIDPAKYITEMGMSPSNVEDMIDNLMEGNPKAANFATILLPKSVLSAYSGLTNNEIKDARIAAYPDALETTKLIVEDIASKSDEELKTAKLSANEIKTIRKAEKHAEAGEDKELMTMLSDKSTSGLSFALLCDQSYWQALGEGQQIGSIAHPEMVTQEASTDNVEKSSPSLVDRIKEAANTIAPFNSNEQDKSEQQTVETATAEEKASFAEKHKKSAKSLDPENFKKDKLSPAAIIAERQAAAAASQEAVAAR